MINNELINTKHSISIYELKQGTTSSYYRTAGGTILPERLGLGLFVEIKKSLKSHNRIAEIKSRYRKDESGLYYNMNDRYIHTSIWTNPNYPDFYGYGIIDERFRIDDLIVIYSLNNCKQSFEIHHFKGLAEAANLDEVFTYLSDFLKKSKALISQSL
jgi:hypothetical protein